jgi:hypothetical protein
VQLVNTRVYLDTTDVNYHLKEILKNTLTESRDSTITASFIDLKTNMTICEKIAGVGGLFGTPHVCRGYTVVFDMNTEYKASERQK